ncbi:DHH family phosphoesterase [Acetanaerobacterium elongatum]|uniref:Phosphoesterase RecJ domain-containing protein n=1 Tax=Acetanaerobacterium elongatum TaxID=258515 RepID=A0A1G9WNJ4_9FIRM|nr:bifunctional oligoribonuclease/PAP phosphatase NrnA [Acetanaerobacterium elongatum]SDM86049.1 phosphoesterase RecJ domain-containing protein [Acetanaerobacterium elongatum]
MNIGLKKVCEALLAHDRFLIITHQSPDGDTLGSGFGLYYGLKQLGKRARVVCSDEFPARYNFLFQDYQDDSFDPEFIVAVDLADKQLFGSQYASLADRVDICIDHHPSNTRYARGVLLKPKAAATCEIIYEVLKGMGVTFDERIGTCIYTGIATDTGCFRFSNTTVNSHRIAAHMMRYNVKIGKINRLMFETKTQSRIAIEQQVLNSIEYYFDNRCAMISVTGDMLKSTGATECELEGLSTLPRQIEGVQIGVMLREKENGDFKVSIRSNDGFDASKICGLLGGGGHVKAAGCVVKGGLENAKKVLIETIAQFV